MPVMLGAAPKRASTVIQQSPIVHTAPGQPKKGYAFATSAAAGSIRSVFRPLRQNAHQRPVLPAPRVPSPSAHFGGIDTVEEIHHFDVGELVEPGRGHDVQCTRVELDSGSHGSPVVI